MEVLDFLSKTYFVKSKIKNNHYDKHINILETNFLEVKTELEDRKIISDENDLYNSVFLNSNIGAKIFKRNYHLDVSSITEQELLDYIYKNELNIVKIARNRKIVIKEELVSLYSLLKNNFEHIYIKLDIKDNTNMMNDIFIDIESNRKGLLELFDYETNIRNKKNDAEYFKLNAVEILNNFYEDENFDL